MDRRIIMMPARRLSRESAAETISAPIPGRAKTVSMTAAPPSAETSDWATSEKRSGKAGRKALESASCFLFIPVERANLEYVLLIPSERALRKTLM